MNYFHIKISRQWSQNGLLSPVRNAILFFFFGGGGGVEEGGGGVKTMLSMGKC